MAILFRKKYLLIFLCFTVLENDQKNYSVIIFSVFDKPSSRNRLISSFFFLNILHEILKIIRFSKIVYTTYLPN